MNGESCVFIYDGGSGGRKGAACVRPEADHCPAKPKLDAMNDHLPECKYALYGRRTMVHHTFHRGRTPNRCIEAVAWDEFEEKNRDLFDLATIGTTPQYLRNRLMHAFQAGIEKGKEIEAGRRA